MSEETTDNPFERGVHTDSPSQSVTALLDSDEKPLVFVYKPKKRNVSAAEKRQDTWKTILEAMKASDEHSVESWKSEMDNLLIFAALYSAVVTAFVVESFKLVSGEDDDSEHTLLEISSQLASFTLSPGFANSTHVTADSGSSDPPPSYAVKVNTLWFLSLTLSIIAAFFGIAIQQWLRHLRLPAHTPLREAIRLRQLRYKGLMKWQVPIIASLLPALVQISVVLFLIGLIQFVRHSDKAVALPFTVVSSICLVLFVIVSLIPLIDPSCPYKSPLVHITWNIGWMAMTIFTIVVMWPLTLLLDCFTTNKHPRLSRYANKIQQFVHRYLLALKPPTTETNHFWTARETEAASRQTDKLDQAALSWALTAGPKVADIECCLEDLPVTWRTRCVMEWISLKFDGTIDMSRMTSRGTLSGDIMKKLEHDEHFADEFGEVLMHVLSDGWGEEDKRGHDIDIPHIVMFLWKIIRVHSKDGKKPLNDKMIDFRKRFIRQLIHVCWERQLDVDHDKSFLGWKSTPRVPPVLLFNILDTKDDYLLFGEEDVVQFTKWAERITGVLVNEEGHHKEAAPMFWFAPQEHILSIGAIALELLVCYDNCLKKEGFVESLGHLIGNLDTFVQSGDDRLKTVLDQHEKLLDVDRGSLPFVAKDAIDSINGSLEILREHHPDLFSSASEKGSPVPADALRLRIAAVYGSILADLKRAGTMRSRKHPTRNATSTSMQSIGEVAEVPILTITGGTGNPSGSDAGSK